MIPESQVFGTDILAVEMARFLGGNETMERILKGHGAFVWGATLVTLTACAQGALSGTVPQGGATTASATSHSIPARTPVAPSRVSGPWGVSVGDMVNASYGQSKMTCSTPSGGICNGLVQQKSFKDALSTSGSSYGGAHDSSSLAANAALGALKGDVSAAATTGIEGSEIVPAGASGTVNIQWEDTFLATSSTLPSGTPVTFSAQMNVASNPKITCNAIESGEIYAVVTGTSPTLALLDDCSGTTFGPAYPPVLSSEVNTNIGSTFTMAGSLDVVASVDSSGASSGSEKTREVTAEFYLDPVTPGASYRTASGKSYRSP